MTLCKNWCRHTRQAVPVALGLLAALFLQPPAAAAQEPPKEPLEQRYQKALKLFSSAEMEDACKLLRQIDGEKPGYKETRQYLNPACSSASQAYDLEQKLFNEGVQLFNQKRLDEARQKFEQASKVRLKNPKYRLEIEGYLKETEGQLSEEKFFNEGIELFNQKRLDEAKQKFEQASKIPVKNPKYRPQIERHLKEIEGQLGEEGLYREAVRLFNDGKDADATVKFAQIARGGGARANDAGNYLQRLKERREDSTWDEAVRLFTNGDFPAARRLLEQVVATNGKRSGDARNYLARIDAAEADQRTFNEAVRAFEQKLYPDAGARFNELIRKGSAHSTEAQMYLQRINVLTKVKETGQDPKQVARQLVANARTAIAGRQYALAVEKLKTAESLDPANHEVRPLLSQAQELATEQPLREGLQAYYQGKYDEAEHYLSTYVDNHGRKLALAYFFRGAAYGSLYFLSGEQNMQQKQLAMIDFRALLKDAPQFQPPRKFVSPKIMSLYSKAVETGAH